MEGRVDIHRVLAPVVVAVGTRSSSTKDDAPMSIFISVMCDECGDILRTSCHQTMPAIRYAIGNGWKVVQHEEMLCAACVETQRIVAGITARSGR